MIKATACRLLIEGRQNDAFLRNSTIQAAQPEHGAGQQQTTIEKQKSTESESHENYGTEAEESATELFTERTSC